MINMKLLKDQEIELIIAALGHFKHSIDKGMDVQNLKRELELESLGTQALDDLTEKFILANSMSFSNCFISTFNSSISVTTN